MYRSRIGLASNFLWLIRLITCTASSTARECRDLCPSYLRKLGDSLIRRLSIRIAMEITAPPITNKSPTRLYQFPGEYTYATANDDMTNHMSNTPRIRNCLSRG